jgi:hypothetical protein
MSRSPRLKNFPEVVERKQENAQGLSVNATPSFRKTQFKPSPPINEESGNLEYADERPGQPSRLLKVLSKFSSTISSCFHRESSQIVPIEESPSSNGRQNSPTLSSRSLYITDRITDMIGGSKTKDLLEFTSHIQMEFTTDKPDSKIQSTKSIVTYTVEIPKLKIFQQFSPFRKYLHRLIEDRPQPSNQDDFHLWIPLINLVTQFIDNIRKMEEGFMSSKSMRSGSLVSFEGCLALTVRKYSLFFSI